MLNVKHAYQLLTHNNRMTIQLLLSSEIDLFEHKQTDFLENSMKILDFGKILYVIYIGNQLENRDPDIDHL